MAVSYLLQTIFYTINKIRYLLYIGTNRLCPICNKKSRFFVPFGKSKRNDALCLYCGSLERHRLTWLFFKRKTNLFNGKNKSMLHFAPEICFINKLKREKGLNYVSADLSSPLAMVKIDITKIEFPDESFDVIYCSHVLEHILNDKCAITELYRVLKKCGWAVISVPLCKSLSKTFEDCTVTEPNERLRLFGDEDHVRKYGLDFIDRLNDAGFIVQIINPSDFLNDYEIERMGIINTDELFFCRKKD